VIPSRKSWWFTRWFGRTIERKLRRSFDVHAHGLVELAALARTRPLLLVANHSSWWDPLVAIATASRFAQDGYAMMEADNLEQLRFFGLVGGFGFRRGDARDGARALRYAAQLLDRPNRVLWMFPQGEQLPADAPLVFHPGAARVAALADAWVVPVALRYRFGAGERAELVIACGPAQPHPEITALRDQVAELLAAIDVRKLELQPLWPLPAARGHGLATRMLDRFAGWWIARFGRALEAAVVAEPQGAIGPANPAGEQTTRERDK
jgi:1-acyl-sn-glycerol-3-phosphate acyltransferase